MLRQITTFLIPAAILLGIACGASDDPFVVGSEDAGQPASDAAAPGDPCAVNNGGCSTDATCTNAGAGVTCTCQEGYVGDGMTCADVDECATGNGACDANATCTNTIGGRTCTCNAGSEGDGVTCIVDECATNNGGCDVNATCATSVGARTCTCNAGFDGDGLSCVLTTLAISADTNLSATNTSTRTCADGGDMVSYSVTALTATTATLSAIPGSGCLSPGDEVLLVNLRGTATSTTNTGNHELLVVKDLVGSTVTFNAAKTKFFGQGEEDDAAIGTDGTAQRVVLQRVPRYGNVVVNEGATLTADTWDGTKGGVLAFSAAGSVTIDGLIDMNGKGYRGGDGTTDTSTTGQQGESIDGLGASATQTSTAGRGGGGRGDGCGPFGAGGGGGGYGTAGAAGARVACGGIGGATYGDEALTRIFFGSGGGSGGTDNVLTDNPAGGFGGRGGGIIFIRADGAASGDLESKGLAGRGDATGVECNFGASTTECFDFSGPGGGGAGGSILLTALTYASGAASVEGGAGGNGSDANAQDGGSGGSGRASTP
jgi:hypothetical protein